MNITLAAIGKCKPGAELELIAKYTKQLPWSVAIREIEIKKNLNGDALKQAEAEQLLAATAPAHRLIGLDERGKNLSSESFARTIDDWQQHGSSHIGCIIGGADGLAPSVRDKADLVLSFGQLTWPHMLARAMLMEQLYRAHTILSGHPYHRS